MAETQAPEGYYFTQKHEWIQPDGNTAKIGITDYAQNALGDIVFVDLPKPGKQIHQGQAFGTIESVKAAEDLYAPVSGEVIEVNPAVSSDPGSINSNPFGVWFIKIQNYNQEELKSLMDANQYKKYVEGLE